MTFSARASPHTEQLTSTNTCLKILICMTDEFNRMKRLSIITLLGVLAGCTWVHLAPEGQYVRVSTHDTIENCEKRGSTRVSLKSEIAGFNKNPEKVKAELETLARNSAPALKGDTIVPSGHIDRGTQLFDVYICGLK
jgi:hypothetical protein